MPDSPFANPLAPATFKPTAGSSDFGAKPLRNADFRQLLMTPRAGATPGSNPSSNPILPVKQKKVKTEDDEARSRARKWQKKQKEGDKPAEPKYRDRARERRDGANPDYDENEANLLAGFHSVPPPTDGSVNPDLHKLTIENSKFLGGDMQHTHLVKGLDYALLTKVKSEMQQKEREEQEKKAKEKEVQRALLEKQSNLGVKLPATLAQAIGATVRHKNKKKIDSPAIAPFQTPLGKAMYTHLLANPERPKTELFLPGRMAFVFDLDEEFPQELPTTLLRSKEDCPQPEDTIVAKVDKLLIDKVSKIMTFLRQGSKSHKKLKKKEKEGDDEKTKANGTTSNSNGSKDAKTDTNAGNQAAKTAPADDDDIFGGAGRDYVCSTKKDDKNKPSKPAVGPKNYTKAMKDTKSSYFQSQEPPMEYNYTAPQAPQYYPQADAQAQGQVSYDAYAAAYQTQTLLAHAQAMAQAQAYSSVQEEVAASGYEPTQEEKDKGLTTVFRRDDSRLRKYKETDEREKDPAFVSDTYTECYPGAYETSLAYESDEEEDITKMDLGSKRSKLKRWDFDDEESWNAYNDQREAMPKAAFQFGVKMADGRKTRRTKENKVEKDLQKINQILKKRAEDAVAAKKHHEGASALVADLEEGEIAPSKGSRRKLVQVDDNDRAKRSRT
jgi:IK cytokine